MIEAEYISPSCCEKSKSSKVVRLGLYDSGLESLKNSKPKWYVVGDDFTLNHHRSTKIEIDKCPFCGQVLPDVELRKDDLKIFDGDGDYCNTCGERNIDCKCYPPEYGWIEKIN